MQKRKVEASHSSSVLPGAGEDVCSTSTKAVESQVADVPLLSTNQEDSCKSTVQFVRRLFDDLLADYIYMQDRHEVAKACEVAESAAEQHYDELCGAVERLLTWVDLQDFQTSRASDQPYDFVNFDGQPRPSQKRRADDEESEGSSAALQESASEALCAALACLASRPEKAWLEAFDGESELTDRRKEFPLESVRTSISAVLQRISALRVRPGYFANALGHCQSSFRLSFVRDVAGALRPACLLVTYNLSFRAALAKMDDDGPLQGPASDWQSRELGFQDLVPAGACGAVKDSNDGLVRQSTRRLEADVALTRLLKTRKPVVMLDAVAALAPRAQARDHKLSAVVKAELAGLLRDAKARGVAVVFMLGGDNPHVLAEKVYLRPPFTDYGLRCGYLRWREMDTDSWAREKVEEKRVCIGLQMP